jgi:hypothetical protein
VVSRWLVAINTVIIFENYEFSNNDEKSSKLAEK